MTFKRTAINVDDLIVKIKAENDAKEAFKKKYKLDKIDRFTELLIFLREQGPGYELNRAQFAKDMNINESTSGQFIQLLKEEGYTKKVCIGWYRLEKIPPLDIRKRRRKTS